jgi:quinone-modifying oxidoreductase subunit QmoC
MHGLAHYANRLGLVPKNQQTQQFAQRFWNNLSKKGRVNELKLGLSLYFMNGFAEGVKTSFKMQKIGLGMLKAKRMAPLEIAGGHGCKDIKGLQAALRKASEIEAAKLAKFQQA